MADNPLEDDVSKLGALLYNHFQDQINLADSKAHLLLAANAALTAAVTGFGNGMLHRLFCGESHFAARLGALLGVLLFAAVAASFYHILSVTRPILKVTDKDTNNLFYFGGIKSFGQKEFLERFSSLSPDELKYEMLIQVHAKAHIAARKFRRIQKSVHFLLAAVFLWALTHILLAFVPR
jgi:hypothetical protein